MTRLATILAVALTAMAIAASSAFAAAPHQSGQSKKDQNDTAAIVVIAGLGLLVAGSALVPLDRKRRRSASVAYAPTRTAAPSTR
jgi:hypothetical protein